MFPRHFPVFRGLMPCKCDRGVLKTSFFEVLKSQATIFGHNLFKHYVIQVAHSTGCRVPSTMMPKVSQSMGFYYGQAPK